MSEPDLTDDIEANAARPKQTTVDGQTVTEHDLPAQIAADKYLKAQRAVSQDATFGLRFGKLIPPTAQ